MTRMSSQQSPHHLSQQQHMPLETRMAQIRLLLALHYQQGRPVSTSPCTSCRMIGLARALVSTKTFTTTLKALSSRCSDVMPTFTTTTTITHFGIWEGTSSWTAVSYTSWLWLCTTICYPRRTRSLSKVWSISSPVKGSFQRRQFSNIKARSVHLPRIFDDLRLWTNSYNSLWCFAACTGATERITETMALWAI